MSLGNHLLENIKVAQNIQVPDELENKIYARMYQAIQRKQKAKRNFKIWLVTASLVLTFSTGFAALNMYEIKNKTGAVNYQVEKSDWNWEQIKQYSGTNFDKTLGQIREDLPPGTAVAVYEATKNERNRVAVTIMKPFEFSDVSAFQDKINEYVKVPSELAEGYSFHQGFISYQTEGGMQYVDELDRDAQQSKQSLAVRKLKLTDIVSEIKTVYKHSQDTIIFKTTNFGGNSDIANTTPYDSKVEQIKINDYDILYTLISDKDGSEQKKIEWVDKKPGSNANLLFTLSTNSKEVTKDQLLKMFKQITEVNK